MRRNSAKKIHLVLITSVLASCGQPTAEKSENTQRVFMRADSTAAYTEVTNNYSQGYSGAGMGSSLLWFMAFRHMGGMLGYSNNNIHPQSVSGTNSAKASAVEAKRGGFGKNTNSTPRSSMGS